jgi:hypothetical protein
MEKIATFYMRAGHVIEIDNVKDVTLERVLEDGSYRSYSITWVVPSNAPALFSLSIKDIVAVKVVNKP